ncbi:MAG TPA: hypothetical protein VIU64_23330 [Polyangia bacterium]
MANSTVVRPDFPTVAPGCGMLGPVSIRFVKATGVAGLAVAMTAALGPAGCGLPDTSPRGFGSTLVLHARDSALSLRSFGVKEDTIYLAHTVPGVIATGGLSVPYDRTLIDLKTGEEKGIANGVLGAWLLPSADGQGRSLAMTHFPTGAVIPDALSGSTLPFVDLTFVDEVQGTSVDLHDVDSQTVRLGATRADPILFRQKVPTETDPFWSFGSPEAPVRMPPVNQIVGRDHLGLIALTASTSGTMTQSLSRIPFDHSPVVELVPGTLNEHLMVADPTLPAQPYAGPSTIATAGVDAAVACPDRSATNPDPRCLLLYDRQRGAQRIPFVHDVDTGTDVELPGPLTGSLASVIRLAPTARDAFWPVVGAGTPRIYAWHVRDTQAASCAVEGASSGLSFGVNGWRPAAPSGAAAAGGSPSAGADFVVVAQPASQSAEKPAAWTLFAGTTGQGCHMVAQGQNLITQLSYAPDGSALALLEMDPVSVSKVYVIDGASETPRLVASGPYFFNIDFHDPRHLLLWHSNIDGYSVSWLDLSTTPATEHPIADGVRWDARGSWTWINSRWVLLADADSPQDGSYSLDVVDLETGKRKLVSSGVRAQVSLPGGPQPPIDFRTPWTTPPDGATTLTVAYIVRSRAPSSQDGLWVAHLPLSDFPP